MGGVDAAVVRSHAAFAFKKLGGTVDMDDLIQIGRITIWKAAKSYDGSGTLEGYMHDCLAKRFRDVVRGERRRRNVFNINALVADVPEPAAPHRPDSRAMLNGVVREYEPVLSAEAFIVMCELVDPSPRTVKAALFTNRRRMHLKMKHGMDVTGFDTVKLLPQHIAAGTNLSLSQVVRAIKEIKRTVRERIPHINTEE